MPSDSTRSFLENSSLKYHDQLNQDAVEYLMGPERGLTQEAIEKFRIGYVAAPEPGHEVYTGCLAIPYLTPKGSVTSIRFRTLPPAKKKYLTVRGDMSRIYNTADLDKGTSAICVAEGEFDAAIASMCGLPTIGLGGVDAWNPLWARLLEPYAAVYTLSDDDENKAGQKLPEILSKDLDNIRDVPMQVGPTPLSGGDVTQFVLAYGADELKKKVGAR